MSRSPSALVIRNLRFWNDRDRNIKQDDIGDIILLQLDEGGNGQVMVHVSLESITGNTASPAVQTNVAGSNAAGVNSFGNVLGSGGIQSNKATNGAVTIPGADMQMGVQMIGRPAAASGGTRSESTTGKLPAVDSTGGIDTFNGGGSGGMGSSYYRASDDKREDVSEAEAAINNLEIPSNEFNVLFGQIGIMAWSVFDLFLLPIRQTITEYQIMTDGLQHTELQIEAPDLTSPSDLMTGSQAFHVSGQPLIADEHKHSEKTNRFIFNPVRKQANAFQSACTTSPIFPYATFTEISNSSWL